MNTPKLLFFSVFVFLLLSCEEFSAQNAENQTASFPEGFKANKELNISDSAKIDEAEVKSPKIKADERLTGFAAVMAGIEKKDNDYFLKIRKPEADEHFADFNQSWEKLEKRHLNPLRAWLKVEVKPTLPAKYNVLYPFSGPDILNAVTTYPDADNYLLFGLENVGMLPNLDSIPTAYLNAMREALQKTFRLNYFITANMSKKLKEKGVSPLLLIFLLRTGHEIVSCERVVMHADGEVSRLDKNVPTHLQLTQGVKVEFFHPEKKKLQTVWFFKGNIADNGLPKTGEIFKFLDKFPDKVALIKSASYLLHGSAFTKIRNYLLDNSSKILQDDTGIPYRYYDTTAWNLKLYGKYSKPVEQFKDSPGYFQKDLLEEYENNPKPRLNFSFGYHGSPDRTSIIFADKKSTP